MKKIIYLMLGIGALCCASCGGPDEVPPRQININNEFIVPIPPPLTEQEWEWLEAKREEYNNATKSS